jgi:hypothetical protein
VTVTRVQSVDVNGHVIGGILRPVQGSTKVIAAAGGTAKPDVDSNDIIRVVFEAAGRMRITSSPTGTAGTTDTYMPANVPEYFRVNAGDYVATITGTAHIDVME